MRSSFSQSSSSTLDWTRVTNSFQIQAWNNRVPDQQKTWWDAVSVSVQRGWSLQELVANWKLWTEWSGIHRLRAHNSWNNIKFRARQSKPNTKNKHFIEIYSKRRALTGWSLFDTEMSKPYSFWKIAFSWTETVSGFKSTKPRDRVESELIKKPSLSVLALSWAEMWPFWWAKTGFSVIWVGLKNCKNCTSKRSYLGCWQGSKLRWKLPKKLRICSFK